MKKIAYITGNTPFGAGEEFVLTEMLALKRSGADMLIIPRDISQGIFHKKAELLREITLSIPWFNGKIFRGFIKYILMKPVPFIKIIREIVIKARNAKIALKNLIILPKSLYLSRLLTQQHVSHIHAHWASTTSTMAYVISKASSIPWSFTTHRWDIKENNLLKEKCKTASFVRAISERGRNEIIEIIKDNSLAKKISVIHTGVKLSEYSKDYSPRSDMFTLLCPANLLPVKGHIYLFAACRTLLDKGMRFKCLIAGGGPIEEELRRRVSDLNLDGSVQFLGKLPHEGLLNLYARGKIDVVILPSIRTKDGEQEGIPVSLMEAMSFGIPVISTNTGGIPELIGDGSGIMVAEKDSQGIADAIEKLMKDGAYMRLLTEKGQKKIEEDFDVSAISQRLIEMFFNNVMVYTETK
jgi:colanic acid/amylovoran biosynthesis glycosyltransferase